MNDDTYYEIMLRMNDGLLMLFIISTDGIKKWEKTEFHKKYKYLLKQ